MNKNMNLPAEYAVLSEEEMTYTQGGSDLGGFATTAVRATSSPFWAVPQMLSARICPSPQPTLSGMPFPAPWWWLWLP